MATSESEEFARREERFIVGVFNYCDRWCERCRFNDRCRVYDSERAMRERHEILGEDPDDIDAVMEDVTSTFQRTIEMLQGMADEMGVAVDEEAESEDVEDEPEEGTRRPLVVRADAWMDRVETLLDQVREEIPELGNELAQSLFRVDDEREVEERGHAILGSLQAARDAYDLLCRYRHLIVIKLMRVFHSLEDSEKRSHGEMAQYSRDDARGTAKLVDDCVGRAVKALWTIAEFHRPWFELAVPLAAEGEHIRQAIGEAVPDFHLFHRPGFDDEPEEGEE